MGDRERLPNRRFSVTETVAWNGHELHISVGFDHGGRPGEVFARLAKVGSNLDAALDDAAVLTSRLLQRGETLADLERGLGRDSTGAPTSIVGHVVAEARRIAEEESTERSGAERGGQ
jgi:hypothetical protein